VRASERAPLAYTDLCTLLECVMELEFAGVVPAATVQRLACDASIRRVLLGPDSAVIDVGRALRVPSGAGRAALRVRDQGCVWPGCDRPPSWTNPHHVLHGGDSNIPNLVLLKSQYPRRSGDHGSRGDQRVQSALSQLGQRRSRVPRRDRAERDVPVFLRCLVG